MNSQDRKRISSNLSSLIEATQLDSVLESLDMSQHSLGYLAVLVAKLGQDTTNTWQQILALCDNFVSVCNNDQIRWSESTGRSILITLVLYQVQPQQSV